MPIYRPTCSWKVLVLGLAVGLGLGAVAMGLGSVDAAQQGATRMAAKASSVYDFTLNDIDGKPVSLSQYKGKVVMLVNTASFCGNTPQYADLEKMYETYKDKGFEILAFPANNFGQQEPGSNEEIKGFCLTKYSVGFPLFSKISVKGETNIRSTATSPNKAPSPAKWSGISKSTWSIVRATSWPAITTARNRSRRRS